MDGETQEGHEGKYGFGPVRTLRDYEKYSGLLFEKRAVQQYTKSNNLAPNPPLYGQEYEKSFMSIFKHCIDIGYSQVPETDYEFWVVAFHDANDETIYRKDADKAEISRMMNDPDGYCKVWRDFQTSHQPAYWVEIGRAHV